MERHVCSFSKFTDSSYAGIRILDSPEGESSSLLSIDKSDFPHTRNSLRCHCISQTGGMQPAHCVCMQCP